MKKFGALKIVYGITEDVSNVKCMQVLSQKSNVAGQIALTLVDYFVKHLNTFEYAACLLTNNNDDILSYLNRSKIDVHPQICLIEDHHLELVDSVYPFKHFYGTFIVRKPEYKPEIFGIFKTISLSVWIAILAVSFFMFLLHYFIWKGNSAFHKALIHIFAILLRQGCILRPSSLAETILMYSWVVGAMFLCLAYNSVFLSFLTIPPVLEIKNIPQLASAVANGEYHCIAKANSGTRQILSTSKEKYLRIIGEDLQNNNLSNENVFEDFFHERSNQNIAFLGATESIDPINVGRKFASEDKFLIGFGAMVVRKDFCCKKMLETFVHRLMASGLFFKFQDDASFLYKFQFLKTYLEKDTSKRILTLTDVAPAFLFLLTGYIISFLVLIGEMILNRKKKKNIVKKHLVKRNKIEFKEDSV